MGLIGRLLRRLRELHGSGLCGQPGAPTPIQIPTPSASTASTITNQNVIIPP
jgi:hypothetical protein